MATPTTVKKLSESGSLASIPRSYVSRKKPEVTEVEQVIEGDIPTIDFSLLVRGTPEQRLQIVQDLGKACQEWGFFMVVNPDVSEKLREAMLEGFKEFFNLAEEEKGKYAGGGVMDPVRSGTSFNTAVEEVRCWRDFLKIFVHPEFHFPAKPLGFRDLSLEYSTCIRELAMELLKGIWESLGLEEGSMKKALDLDSCLQILAGNLYPPCPQPELAIGLPGHSDHGLLTVLLQNGIDGLHVKHKGNWVRVKAPPNSFLVNTGDHMEIVSNGRYKSVLHRADVNCKNTRMSIATALGPSLDTVVAPAAELTCTDECPVAYRGMKYREFLNRQQGNRLEGKSVLDLLRIDA